MSDQRDGGIAWTDETWNPVTGCAKVSPGCAHCYAETVALRFWATQYPPVEYDTYSADNCCQVTEMRAREFTDVQCHEDRLDQPLRWKRPRRVFVNSMSDLFHEDVPDAFIDKIFAVMALAPQHTFQCLTKRAERMLSYMRAGDLPNRIAKATNAVWGNPYDVWPLPNVWLGVSCENQHFADERIPLLLQTPAAVRFISAEPLLGPISFRWAKWQPLSREPGGNPHGTNHLDGLRRLNLVIVGGESGPKARPCDLVWIRSIRDQCQAAGVPVFVKQMGSQPTNSAQPDGDLVQAFITGKGADISEWPEDLRVREMPT